jgi:hypothetical protein
MLWRLIAQLTELMPQLMRLIPLLDRFNNNASTEMMNALQSGVGDLHDSHRTLVSQLKDQSLHFAAIEAKLEQQQIENGRLQLRVEELREQAGQVESRLGWLLAAVALLVVVELAGLALIFFVRK